ncbi:MAG TPA: hypothetical protein DHV88_05985 [Roseburia sp.]|nr:hypothetical protein [Roseburia sp.]
MYLRAASISCQIKSYIFQITEMPQINILSSTNTILMQKKALPIQLDKKGESARYHLRYA